MRILTAGLLQCAGFSALAAYDITGQWEFFVASIVAFLYSILSTFSD